MVTVTDRRVKSSTERCAKDGLLKIVQKLCLTCICAYFYTTLSAMVPSCSMANNGWKIYPFDEKFFASSVILMSTVAIHIVECNIWPYNTRPRNPMIRAIGEVREFFVYFFMIISVANFSTVSIIYSEIKDFPFLVLLITWREEQLCTLFSERHFNNYDRLFRCLYRLRFSFFLCLWHIIIFRKVSDENLNLKTRVL